MVEMQISNKRTYSLAAERQRDLIHQAITIKDSNYFNKTDSLWNEKQRLSPRLQQYSHQNVDPRTTFKPRVVQYEQLAQIEREEMEQKQQDQVLASRLAVQQRYRKRKLERLVNQYRSRQQLTEQEKAEVVAIA